ncbi:hypothetical protein GCM10022214_83150 [Actinomadura miaoliensis]|uniref:Major facilitator superfamily (MFS) profile domain-containing protein n=2 Tax=Actinomadura miaoliensis TaxID=430685 RepID=A0ABP7X4K5_9ACTN
MITMDNTVVANALPTIMADLDMSTSAKDWVATGYILMFSCLMIAGGRLTDVYGCRVTFVSGMTVFTAASAACGLAPDATLLILARVAQGAGAALALPATQVMVTVGRSDKQRSLGMIVWVGAGSTATALGPTIGGLIVQHWHWGWIFLINIVPGVLVILLGLVVLTGHGENADARVDLPGVLISATMLFAFTYGLEEGRTRGWTDPSVLSVFALVLIALVCFVAVESWAPDPMIDLRFFRNRVFTGGLLSQMLYGIGFNGMIFYSATFLQRYLGFTPPEAGLVMLPPSIAIMVLTPVGFWLAAKIGPRGAIGGGMALMAFGMFLFSTLRRGDGYAELMPGVMIVGAGAALGMPLVMYVLKAVPEHQAGVASGIINVIREASGAFGIAIVGLLVHEVPEAGASTESLETFRDGTASGLIVGAAAVLIGGLICGLTLPSKRGWLGPKHGKHSTSPETTPTPEPALTAPIPTTQNPLPHNATPPDGALLHQAVPAHKATAPTEVTHPHDTLTRRKATPPAPLSPHDAPPPAAAPRHNAAPLENLLPPRDAPPRDAAPPQDGLPPRETMRARDATPPANTLPREATPPHKAAQPHAAPPHNAAPPENPPPSSDAVPRDALSPQSGLPPHDTMRARDATPPGNALPPEAAPPHEAVPPHAAAPSHKALPPQDAEPPPDVLPLSNAMPSAEAGPSGPPDAVPTADVPPPRDAVPSQDVLPSPDAWAPREAAPPKDVQPPHDAPPRDAVPPHDVLPRDVLPPEAPEALALPGVVPPPEAVPPSDAPRPRNAAPSTEVVPPDDVSARGAIPRDAGPPRDALPPRGAVRARDALPPSGARPRWEALSPDDVLPSRSAVPFDSAEPPSDVPQPRDAVPSRSDVVASGEVVRRSPFPPPPEGWYHPYVPEDDTDPWGEWEVPRRGDAW